MLRSKGTGTNGASKIRRIWDDLSPRRARGFSPGFQPYKRLLVVKRFDGRMAFVPEGQADSSQARSAWIAMQKTPVPEGRLKSLSAPEPRSVQSSRWDEAIFLMTP